jgi:hypothetical protein
MRRATIYRRKKQFLVHTSSRTTAGVWILSQPCVAISDASDDREFGQAIRLALAGSKTDVPHPQTWKGLLDPLLVLAQVKTWNTFSKQASCVEVEQEDSRIIVIPTKNLGPEEGFQPDSSKQVVLARDSDELGATVRKLLPVLS